MPTVHITAEDGIALIALLDAARTANATPTAQIAPATATFDAVAPFVASFSSRGPSSNAGQPLKPDILAPGVDVFAPWYQIADVDGLGPPPPAGDTGMFLSGTSTVGVDFIGPRFCKGAAGIAPSPDRKCGQALGAA